MEATFFLSPFLDSSIVGVNHYGIFLCCYGVRYFVVVKKYVYVVCAWM